MFYFNWKTNLCKLDTVNNFEITIVFSYLEMFIDLLKSH